jgi:hypothetical protein
MPTLTNQAEQCAEREAFAICALPTNASGRVLKAKLSRSSVVRKPMR